MFKVWRPVAFETETRPETFETKSRDSITGTCAEQTHVNKTLGKLLVGIMVMFLNHFRNHKNFVVLR